MSEVPAGVPKHSPGQFVRNVLKLASGTTISQGLTVLIAPLLTRLYPPEAFGTLAIFGSITAILGVIACLRYELAILLPESDGEAANLLAVSLVSVVGLSLLTVPAAIWGWSHSRQPEASSWAAYLWLVPPMVLASGLFLALSAWSSRKKRFGRISGANVTNTAVNQILKVGAGYGGLASGGSLIGATVIGQAFATLVLKMQVWRNDGKLFRESIRWRGMVASARRYRKFPLLDTWGGVLNGVSWQLPVIVLAVHFSQAVVGLYALASKLVCLPMLLGGAAVGQVFLQKAAERKADGRLAQDTSRVFQRLVTLALPPALLLAVVGRDAFGLILGEKWSEAGTYAQILSGWMFFWMVSSPLSGLFAVKERQGLALVVHVAIFVTRLAALLIGGWFGSVYLSLGLFAASGAIIYGVLAIWCLSLASLPFPAMVRAFSRGLPYALPGPLLLLALKQMNLGAVWLTVAAAAALAVCYAAVIRNDPDLRRAVRLREGET